MSEKPILFNSEMVRAILDGRKTQTRRVIKPQPYQLCRDIPNSIKAHHMGNALWRFEDIEGRRSNNELRCPYGAPGDLLWVRETWATIREYDDLKPSDIPVYDQFPALYYRAWLGAAAHSGNRGKWRSSIHMPRWASRLTLRVTDVQVERVQSITPTAAIEEGVIEWAMSSDFSWNKSDKAYPLFAFQHLWDSINAKRGFGWDVNPWVWCVEFECIGDSLDAPR